MMYQLTEIVGNSFFDKHGNEIPVFDRKKWSFEFEEQQGLYIWRRAMADPRVIRVFEDRLTKVRLNEQEKKTFAIRDIIDNNFSLQADECCS